MGRNATTPPLRILAPVTDEGATNPAVASPPPARDVDDATTEGLPVQMQPIVSVPDGSMPAPTTPPTPVASSTTKPPSQPPVVTAVRAPLPDDALPDDGEINGQVLKRLREKRGLSLDELVEQTKIRKAHIQAIEEQDLERLPARVYLRGYLTQIARVLKVDRHRLAEGYLAFVERFQNRPDRK